MKRMGRAHRPFYRICAIDKRSPRDGRALELLGTYDPSLTDTDARAVLNHERIAYWLSVGAQPSEKMAVLIKKYGPNGTHLEQQKAALDKLAQAPVIPDAGEPASLPKPPEAEKPPEEAPAEAPAEQAAAEEPKAEEAAAEEAAAEPAAEETPEEKPVEKPADA